MDASISPICRFCLEENEEFFHLANSCPALYWDRQQIWSQEPCNQDWSAQQIFEFTLIPKINEAFAKPLYITHTQRNNEIQSQRPPPSDPDNLTDMESQSSQSDVSVMDASSDTESSDQDMTSNPPSDIDIDILN